MLTTENIAEDLGALAEKQARRHAQVRAAGKAWRVRNLERARQIEAASARKRYAAVGKPARAAKRALVVLPTGRVLGQRGATPQLSLDEKKRRRAERQRRWREANKDYMREFMRSYCDENRESVNANARNHRARAAASLDQHTADDITRLLKCQNGKCAFCLKPLGKKTPHVDHYMPLVLGGSNGSRNLRLLHPRCNTRKGRSHPADFGLRHGLLAW